jgi:hypothetical protein
MAVGSAKIYHALKKNEKKKCKKAIGQFVLNRDMK